MQNFLLGIYESINAIVDLVTLLFISTATFRLTFSVFMSGNLGSRKRFFTSFNKSDFVSFQVQRLESLQLEEHPQIKLFYRYEICSHAKIPTKSDALSPYAGS